MVEIQNSEAVSRGQQSFLSEVQRTFWAREDFVQWEVMVVAHVLETTLPFLKSIPQGFARHLLIPKRASTDRVAVDCADGWHVREDWLAPNNVTGILQGVDREWDTPTGRNLLILDVGGKFAPQKIQDCLQQRFRRVVIVEDTENGHQKYQEIVGKTRAEIWSVARSVLKEPEDYWTGRGIVEATETILRTQHHVLADLPCTVFGYGKIGRSIAHALREKRLLVNVVEVNPVRRMLARCHGFRDLDQETALAMGGFVFLATGSAKGKSALVWPELLAQIKHDAWITFATSHDDEVQGYDQTKNKSIPFEGVYMQDVRDAAFTIRRVLGFCVVEAMSGNVRIINDGKPPNFLFQAACGRYIELVQAAILATAGRAMQGPAPEGIGELATDVQGLYAPSSRVGRLEEQVASLWVQFYG